MITTIWTRPDGTKFRADPRLIHTYINCRLETREPTTEEIKELRIPEAIVEVIIPEAVYKSEQIQQLIDGFRAIYSGLDIRTYEGNTHIGNIDLADIKKFITKEIYEQLKGLWTIRPPEVEALFADKPKNEKPTA